MSENSCRVNVTLPKELAERVERELPGLNRSQVFQEALRARRACQHETVVCASCGSQVEWRDLALERLERFFLDAWTIVGDASRTDHGPEFIARRLRDLAVAHGLDRAGEHPLPRRPRVQHSRQANQ